MKNNYTKLLSAITFCVGALLSGCVSLNTFPTIARAGDTVSVMIGGSEKVKKSDVSALFTDASGQIWNLQALGLVRSVFNLRTDGRANGLHYSSWIEKSWSWTYGHEPLQTVLVTDLPPGVAPGMGSLSVFMNVNDNSGGGGTFKMGLEIIPGVGKTNQFTYHNAIYGDIPADFTKLEPAPHAKIKFPGTTSLIGAASLVISFDNAVLNPNDLNIFVPESTVSGSYSNPGAFGKTQRMVYWHHDGTKLYVDIVAPQGIDFHYLQFFVVHPRGLAGSPAFSILSAQVYGTDGNAIAVTPTLVYSP